MQGAKSAMTALNIFPFHPYQVWKEILATHGEEVLREKAEASLRTLGVTEYCLLSRKADETFALPYTIVNTNRQIRAVFLILLAHIPHRENVHVYTYIADVLKTLHHDDVLSKEEKYFVRALPDLLPIFDFNPMVQDLPLYIKAREWKMAEKLLCIPHFAPAVKSFPSPSSEEKFFSPSLDEEKEERIYSSKEEGEILFFPPDDTKVAEALATLWIHERDCLFSEIAPFLEKYPPTSHSLIKEMRAFFSPQEEKHSAYDDICVALPKELIRIIFTYNPYDAYVPFFQVYKERAFPLIERELYTYGISNSISMLSDDAQITIMDACTFNAVLFLAFFLHPKQVHKYIWEEYNQHAGKILPLFEYIVPLFELHNLYTYDIFFLALVLTRQWKECREILRRVDSIHSYKVIWWDIGWETLFARWLQEKSSPEFISFLHDLLSFYVKYDIVPLTNVRKKIRDMLTE